ncbi:MAG: glutaredoxin [Bacilli bacterium]|nr:glutaredoxin [Bacilli bacterium]
MKFNKNILIIILGVVMALLVSFGVLYAIYKVTSKEEIKEQNPNFNIPDLSHGEGSIKTNKVSVYVFKRNGCAFCRRAMEYLQSIMPEYTYLDVKTIEVSEADNKELMQKVAAKLNKGIITTVPFIVIGEDYTLNGYSDTRNQELNKAITDAYNSNNYVDVVQIVIDQNSNLEVVLQDINS